MEKPALETRPSNSLLQCVMLLIGTGHRCVSIVGDDSYGQIYLTARAVSGNNSRRSLVYIYKKDYCHNSRS